MRAEAVAPSLAHGWLTNFTRAAVSQAVGAETAAALLGESHLPEVSANPFHDLAHELVIQWLEQGAPAWVGEIASLLAPAFEATIAKLTQMFGPDSQQWQWGRLHYVKFEHPLARIPALGRLWRPSRYPLGGDGYTVNQAEAGAGFPPPPVAIIPSCRMILDVGAWDNSISALPGGQSGLAGSEHFQDGIEEWVEGRYHPMLFSRSRIEAEARARLHLLPASPVAND
jgi:penicillin amidase